jgi:glucose/arabinose dehydrogenase
MINRAFRTSSLASSLASLLVFAGPVPLAAQDFKDGPPAEGQHPAFRGQTRAPRPASSVAYRIQLVAEGLNHPWGMAWLPDGRILVTERPGRLRLVSDGTLSPPVTGVPTVAAVSNGGLLDLALDPSFRFNRLIYLSYLEPRGGGVNGVSVARARLDEVGSGYSLDGLTVIFRAQPGAPDGVNVGSRLAFGRDGKLYVTIGDRMELRDQAQSLTSDLGKVVRINADGSIPRDNPYASRPGARPELFSVGHRDPEGLTINPLDGVIWEHEHGPKGGDEVNIIQPGRNYGWPVITYGVDYSGAKVGIGTQEPGLEQPVYFWDPSIAPSGMTFYTGALFAPWRGDLFVGALKAERLVRLILKGDRVVGEEDLLTDLHERIRDVRQGPDGALYVLTDNDAGRILKLVPPLRAPFDTARSTRSGLRKPKPQRRS